MYICVIGVVIKGNTILMIEKSDPDGKKKYVLPGGHWEFTELFVRGAIREVYEETGVTTKPGRLIQIRLNKDKNRLELYYLLEYISSPSKLEPIIKDGEVDGIFIPKFIDKSSAFSLRINTAGMAEVVQKFQEGIL